MIPVAVATVVTPDGFAPLDPMVAAGFNGDTRYPDVYLSSRGRDVRGTKCAKSNAGSK
jgi:hypothetical protein